MYQSRNGRESLRAKKYVSGCRLESELTNSGCGASRVVKTKECESVGESDEVRTKWERTYGEFSRGNDLMIVLSLDINQGDKMLPRQARRRWRRRQRHDEQHAE